MLAPFAMLILRSAESFWQYLDLDIGVAGTIFVECLPGAGGKRSKDAHARAWLSAKRKQGSARKKVRK